ncbi:MAG: ABC transporter ATP-binding protein [Desulfovibrio sp.]|jgi:branched-chain amino acid transport system ATP-binding protein|nr:ABC transporter ATP-binding protein [Desulfovibrio sp.]
MLRIESLSTFYGAVQALKGVSLEVRQGAVVSLLGSNGAGKSTLIRSITGLVAPRAGSIVFKSENITGKSTESISRRGIACVPEGRHIFPGLNVEDNLLMGTVSRGKLPQSEVAENLKEIYRIFPILQEFKKKPGWQLSGGQQQMLAIGRGLMARPQLLLLDEPSLGLAPVLVQEVFRVIRSINEQSGTTILLVEQNARMALSVASRAYVLATGQVVMENSAEKLLADKEMHRHYLGGGKKEG